MVAIYHGYNNFCRVHQTLRVTRAMEAGLTDHVWSLEELVGLLDSKALQTRRMMNKSTYARAYGLVLATMFAILVTDLVYGVWPQLHAALLLAMCIILGAGFYILGLWIMSYRIEELKRKLPISGAERRRRNKHFYDWLRSQGRR